MRGLLLSVSLPTLEVERWRRTGGGGCYCCVFQTLLVSKLAHPDHKGFVQYRSRTFVYIPQSDTSYRAPLPGHDVFTQRFRDFSRSTAVTLINKKRAPRATSRAKEASRSSYALAELNAA